MAAPFALDAVDLDGDLPHGASHHQLSRRSRIAANPPLSTDRVFLALRKLMECAPMINKNIDDITAQDLLQLVADATPEGKMLDYKEAIRLDNKDGRRTFCEHASSFANAAGGWLLYGIREARDEDDRCLGIPAEVVGLSSNLTDDELIRAADDALRHGLMPRLDARARVVDGFEGGARVLVVHVVRSFRAPHMVASGRAKFFSRSNAGKEEMDAEQLRVSFGVAGSLSEQVREFRLERVGRVVAHETPVRFHNARGRVVLHLVPLSAFSASLAESGIPQRAADSRHVFPLYDERNAYSHHFNLDGFCFHDELDEDYGASGYVQFFRQGMIEAVDSIMLSLDHRTGAGRLMTAEIETRVEAGLRRYVRVAIDDLGIRGPAVVMLSLVNVRGYMLDVEEYRLARCRPIDRAQVLLPEVMVEDIEDAADPVTLRPIFDAMWQAAGARRSPNLGEDGEWTAPKT